MRVPEYFGSMVFDDRVMKARLSADVYYSLKKTIDEGEKLDLSAQNRAVVLHFTAGGIIPFTGDDHYPAGRPCGLHCNSQTDRPGRPN